MMHFLHQTSNAGWHGMQLNAEDISSTSSYSVQLTSVVVTLSMSQEIGVHAGRLPLSNDRGTNVYVSL